MWGVGEMCMSDARDMVYVGARDIWCMSDVMDSMYV